MREPIMRIYDAHRDLHHNMHVCPEADWVGCLISCMERDAEIKDPCSCDGGGAITHEHDDATCTGGHDSACFPEIKCRCIGHKMAGVSHLVACCDEPHVTETVMDSTHYYGDHCYPPHEEMP